jgi:hypothetical protein
MCRNQRFLSKDAPHLPLPDCPNAGKCLCHYRHYEDRRTNPRRSADMGGGLPSESPKTNRRQTRGRRAEDKR